MNDNLIRFLAVTLFCCSLSAVAAESETDTTASEKRPPAIGDSTTQWLALQRSGTAAGNLLPIPGAEAGPSLQRYLNSFAKPIPDQLLTEVSVSSLQK